MRRSRSPASSYCNASARDSSHWDVWAFRAKLRLKSGMPCLGLEFSMAQTGRLFSRDGYLHQSPSSPTNDIRITGTIKDGENALNEPTNGKQILWINGRIVYMTIKTPHQSAFCFYLLPDLTKAFTKWRFNGCRSGNWAN